MKLVPPKLPILLDPHHEWNLCLSYAPHWIGQFRTFRFIWVSFSIFTVHTVLCNQPVGIFERRIIQSYVPTWKNLTSGYSWAKNRHGLYISADLRTFNAYWIMSNHLNRFSCQKKFLTWSKLQACRQIVICARENICQKITRVTSDKPKGTSGEDWDL